MSPTTFGALEIGDRFQWYSDGFLIFLKTNQEEAVSAEGIPQLRVPIAPERLVIKL